MNESDPGTASSPWFVTTLAVFGWIGLLLPFAYMFWYQNRYGGAPAWNGFFQLIAIWFVTGVTMVTVDTLRAKTLVERLFWIFALLFWAVAVLIALDWLLGIDWLQRLPYHPYLPIVIGLMQTEFLTTVLLLTPLYVLFLSYIAIRAWHLKLSHH